LGAMEAVQFCLLMLDGSYLSNGPVLSFSSHFAVRQK